MLTVNLPTRTIRIVFAHPSEMHVIAIVEQGDGHREIREEQRLSTCHIFEVPGPGKLESVGFGRATCSASDNFNKETGRKVALTRALENAAFTRLERSVVWQAYRGRKES